MTDKIKQKKVLQVKNVRTSEKASKAKQKTLELEIRTDERSLSQSVDLETTASRVSESLHEVSTPNTKLDQDANNYCHSTEGRTLLKNSRSIMF